MRYVFIILATALACLGLTGLRVAILDVLPRPAAPLVSPRTIREPDPPPAAPPVETIASRRTRLPAGGEDAAAVRWSAWRP